MPSKLIIVFIKTAGLLLTTIAIAKFISSAGSAHILQDTDPILIIPFQKVLWIVGAVELAIALTCLFGRHIVLQIGLVAWLTTAFVTYRLGIVWLGYHKPCPCLGNLTDALQIPLRTVDTTMKIILAYLLIGSYATLFWFWMQKRKAVSASAPSAPSPTP